MIRLNQLGVQIWIQLSRLRFLLLPVERRVCLDLQTDGRFLTFMLIALYEAGLGVHVIGNPAIFRELVQLKKVAPLPFIAGGKPRKCGLVITDQSDESKSGVSRRRIQLDYDFFRPGRKDARMPYFMHPSSYHQGLHLSGEKDFVSLRPQRLLFLGAHVPALYADNFQFPILSRTEILSEVKVHYPDACHEAIPGDILDCPRRLCFVLDPDGGDSSRTKLPARDLYFRLMQQTEFFLCPPGNSMPFAHNLIEAMSCGCIPMTNYATYFDPPLTPDINCVAFDSVGDLRRTIERCLALDAAQIQKLRCGVKAYYEEYLSPQKWFNRLLRETTGDVPLLVNNEEKSLALLHPLHR